MLLQEKISIIRKMNNLTQEAFAEELMVSRQAISKWENGTSVPDMQMLLRIADYYNMTLDQLVRDEFDLPMPQYIDNNFEESADFNQVKPDFCIKNYLGKICDVSMNSFRYSVLRNVQIVGIVGSMVCFVKKNRYGYFNKNKTVGILIKSEAGYSEKNEIECGKCTIYVNKGTYFGGQTYAYSSIENVSNGGIEIHTGKFVTNVSCDDLSVIMMSNVINKKYNEVLPQEESQ